MRGRIAQFAADPGRDGAVAEAPRAERLNISFMIMRFKRFVTEHFPEKRGRGDATYAVQLWDFRCAFVKDKSTGPFALIHDAPSAHRQSGPDGRPLLNLESLIADFRAAVDHLGHELGGSVEMCQVAADELARRHASVSPLDGGSSSPSFTSSETRVVLRGSVAGAKSASAPNE